MNQKIRVAITIVPSQIWQGGFNYQLNLCKAINTYFNDRVIMVACFEKDASEQDKQSFMEMSAVEVIESSAFSGSINVLTFLSIYLLGIDRKASRVFKERKIDIIFESAKYFGRAIPFPTIAWIPDLQHKYLPGNFSFFSRVKREIGFLSQMKNKRVLLVSSKTVRNDITKFYPKFRGKIVINRFPSIISIDNFSTDPAGILKEYCLPQSFIYLPNQFWKHKNHMTVIEATRILKSRGESVCVVATGSPWNPHFPGLYNVLKEMIKRYDLQESFRMLGLVPREHVFAFFRSCAIYLNPSQHEGWSTGVEEAKVFQVPMILSDIPIHREQANGDASFFPTGDFEYLADLMSVKLRAQSGERQLRNLAVNFEVEIKNYANRLFNLFEDVQEARQK